MANRVTPTPRYADNSSGSPAAACIVWRSGDADSMSARDIYDPTTDAGYTTAGALPSGPQSIRLLLLLGESIYEGLGLSKRAWTLGMDQHPPRESARENNADGD